MLLNLLIFFLAFCGIWVGSGLAIKSVERLAKALQVSSFAVSFLVLGFFTSLSEFSVGINAVLEGNPEIYVGNLIGASIVIFMLLMPLLAITGNKINVSPAFQKLNLPIALIVIALPVILSLDAVVGRNDALLAIVLFGFLAISIQTQKGVLEKIKGLNSKSGTKIGRELLKVLAGLVIIFVASRFIVEQTLYFSEVLNLSPFLISLLVISLGTNVPELSLVIRSAFLGNTEVAFGDFIGSAAFNSFLFGVLTLLYGKPVVLTNSYLVSLAFLIVGLVGFYIFARTKNSISRWEGLVLLGLYVLFLVTEIAMH